MAIADCQNIPLFDVRRLAIPPDLEPYVLFPYDIEPVAFADAFYDVGAGGGSCHYKRVRLGYNSALEVVADVKVDQQEGQEYGQGDKGPDRPALRAEAYAERHRQEQQAEGGEGETDVVAGFQVPRQQAVGVGDGVPGQVIFCGELLHFSEYGAVAGGLVVHTEVVEGFSRAVEALVNIGHAEEHGGGIFPVFEHGLVVLEGLRELSRAEEGVGREESVGGRLCRCGGDAREQGHQEADFENTTLHIFVILLPLRP